MKAKLVKAEEHLRNCKWIWELQFESYEPLELGDYEITKYRPSRSIEANSKYWKCVRELAGRIDSSVAEVHNILLSRYGVLDIDENGNIIKVVMKDDFDYLKCEDMHLQPTKHTTMIDGVVYRLFYKLKNSSEFNSQEMARLIDGVLSELGET